MAVAQQPEERPQIRRKDNIPESQRTPDRDDMADVIERMWPATFTDMAEEAGYSRQHAKNTFDAYFEKLSMGPSIRRVDGGHEMRVTIPDDVENVETYLRGVFEGFLRAREYDRER